VLERLVREGIVAVDRRDSGSQLGAKIIGWPSPL
jgi:hypothetical protein